MDILKQLRDARGGVTVFDLESGAAKGQLYELAAAEIEMLREALRKVAIVSHHRMAEGGGTVPSGFSCEICQVECGGKLSELRHMSDCPLFPFNLQQ